LGHNKIFQVFTSTFSVIDPVLQNNAFSFHPENLILAMLSDNRSYIRKLGLRKILKAKVTNTHEHKSNVRRFRVPKINF